MLSFQITEFSEPVLFSAFNADVSTPLDKASKKVFKLKFDLTKFLQDNYKCGLDSQTSEKKLKKHHDQIAKFQLSTNYSNFDVELFIFDNTIRIVSFCFSV